MAWRPRDPESYFKVKTVWPDIIYIRRKTATHKKMRIKDKKTG